MFKFMKHVLVVASIATTSFLGQNVALAGGGFSASCPARAGYWVLTSKFLLEAFCYDEGHNLRGTEVSLGDHIANDDGRLVWQRNGGFQGSIVNSNCSLLSEGVTVLNCEVYRRNGTIAVSSITLDDEIANYNGNLTVIDGF